MSAASLPPEQRFTDRVENYVRYRPSYPDGVLDLLRRDAGLGSASHVADVGSGTGISAALLLRAGCTVSGVEPNRAMREAAERLLAAEPSFRSVDGTAEATSLADGSVDLIVAAQAFHWFRRREAREEFNRILKPAGRVVLMWNERRLAATPFLRDYEQLLLKFAVDYREVRHENIGEKELGEFFRGGAYQIHAIPHQQSFGFAGLKGRLLSSSYVPAEDRPEHAPMLEGLRRIFEQHQSGGLVRFEYDTRVFLGR